MRGNVVVVDDDEETATLLARLLGSRGYTAIALTTASACLDRVARGDIDVVVVDIQLCDISGFALCRELRRVHPGIRVILTGQLEASQTDEANAAGAFDYLTKPVVIEALDQAVTHAFEVTGRMRAIVDRGES